MAEEEEPEEEARDGKTEAEEEKKRKVVEAGKCDKVMGDKVESSAEAGTLKQEGETVDCQQPSPRANTKGYLIALIEVENSIKAYGK